MKAFLSRLNWQQAALILILVVSFLLRVVGLDWDDLNHYHPDERYLVWVASSIAFKAEGLHPHSSSFNPYYWPDDADSERLQMPQGEDRRFAYGHLPLYALVISAKGFETAGRLADLEHTEDDSIFKLLLKPEGLIEFDHLLVVGRLLTALVSTGTVLLVYLIASRLFNPRAGLVGAIAQALAVISIQSAHFFIVDPWMVFFLMAAVYGLIRLQEGERTLWHAAAGSAWGLAVGSKFTAVLFIIPAAAFLMVIYGLNRKLIYRLILFGAAAIIAFAVTNPYSLLDWTCQNSNLPVVLGINLSDLDPGMCLMENIVRQQKMASGSSTFPFTHQYEGSLPFLYPIGELFKWGLGPALTIFAAGAFIFFGIKLLRERDWQKNGGILLLVGWSAIYFAMTGGVYVKFLRYSLPLLPMLFIMCGGWIETFKSRNLKWVILRLVLIPTTLSSLAFVNLYQQEHPWSAGSEWADKNGLDAGSVVEEKWDQQNILGFGAERVDWISTYGEGDNREKLEENLAVVLDAEYYVIASNRIYGVVGAQSDKYPVSSQFYDLLFSGKLGFKLEFISFRSPEIFGLMFTPQRMASPNLAAGAALLEENLPENVLQVYPADESFTVYDQPLVMVFKNHHYLDAAAGSALFDVP